MFDSARLMYSSGGAGFYSKSIEQSLRFNDNDSAYLSRTPSSAGNQRTATISFWVKRGNLNSGSQMNVVQVGDSPNPRQSIIFYDDNTMAVAINYSGSTWYAGYTNAVYRDVSSWYHIVVKFDLTNGTAADRVKLYVNNEQVSFQSTPSWLNSDMPLNSATVHRIGTNTASAAFFDGYISEFHLIDGTALDPTSFGEFKSGVWIPKEYSGSYGTNGFYLPFSGTFYNDASGNGNNWTASGLAATDVVLDSPTNNFATLNPLRNAGQTLVEGNLSQYVTNNAGYRNCGITYAPEGLKGYFEFTCDGTPNALIGTAPIANNVGQYDYSNSWYWQFYTSGYTYYGLTEDVASSTSAFSDGDVGMVAFDFTGATRKIWIGRNGTWGSDGSNTGDPANGNYPLATFSDERQLVVGSNTGAGDLYTLLNFGQDSSFAGRKTAQGNTDDNGYGDFYYAPPTGYLALCTANLTVPDAMNPALDNSPQDHFNTSIWTGNGTTNRAITGVGFQPDFVWIKNRTSGYAHNLFNVLQGATKYLESNTTSSESTETESLKSFDSDGYTLGTRTNVNESSSSHVGWSWKANGSGVSNTDGSITSTVSANTDAGFSIVTYTGNETAGDTVGHGLSSAPEMLIIKRRSAIENWQIYHHAIASDAETDYLEFTTAAAADNVNRWNDTAPTSSVVTLGTHAGLNHSGSTYVMYAFHGVEGFSKFGSYTGNGSTDGPFIYTGFRPAFVMVKKTTNTGNWAMYDNKRDVDNVIQHTLWADVSDAELSPYDRVDLVSNGFKFRDTGSGVNNSGETFIYMAFAENPFKYANAR